MPLTSEKLKRLISSGENEKIDFKRRFDLSIPHLKEEFVKDVSAQANTPGGTGFLIYGVSDNKQNLGILSSSFKETQMQQIISAWCDPKIPFSAYIVNYLNKKLGIVEIPRSPTNPHQNKFTGAFYIRRGTTTDKMTTQEILLSAKKRIDNERYQVKEYDYLSPDTRLYKIREDLFEFMETDGFKHKGEAQNITQYDYEYPPSAFQYYKPDIFEHQKSKLRMFITVESESPEWHDLRNWILTVKKFSSIGNKFQNPKWINVFLLIMYGSVSNTKLGGFHKYSRNTTFVKLNSSTLYYGLGQIDKKTLKNLRVDYFDVWMPKYFIINTHSKDQLQSRINLIPSHIAKIRKSIEDYCRTLRTTKSR